MAWLGPRSGVSQTPEIQVLPRPSWRTAQPFGWALGVGRYGGVMMAAQQNGAAPEACAGVSLQVLGVSVHGRGDGFVSPMDTQ